MDAETLKSFLPEFTRFVGRFADCFCDHRCREHLPVYIRGQLSNLDRKSVEPIAIASGVATRTLQEFLALLSWDHERMLDQLQQIVAAEHAGPGSVGLLDETSFVKKGTKTPGVQRQWCGTLGKVDNDELLARHPQLRDVPWTQYRLDDRQKGPSVWEVKHVRFHPTSEDGLPGEVEHLLVARHVLQDADVNEGRTYTGLMRHLYLTLVSYLFAMRAVEARRGEKPGVDGAASASGGRRASGREVAKRIRLEEGIGATGGRSGVSSSTATARPGNLTRNGRVGYCGNVVFD
jgi:hypothetical protein